MKKRSNKSPLKKAGSSSLKPTNIFKPSTIRLIAISAFLGLDLVLGYHFLQQPHIQDLIHQLKQADKTFSLQDVSLKPSLIIDMDQQVVLDNINQYRQEETLPDLEIDPELTQAAENLLSTFKENNYDLDQNYQQQIIEALADSDYQYRQFSNLAVLGPTTSQGVIRALFDDEKQTQILMNPKYTKAGFAYQTVELDGQQLGLSVQIISEPCDPVITTINTQPPKTPATISTASTQPAPTREIPDNEVVEALNQYRASHGIHQLIIDQNLCLYAQKRAEDLIKNQALDNHQGFAEDFADPNNQPVGIKDYSGGRVGENLASQYCINGTTGESFVAETGTALIEWCFDSSTKGHREAQLDPKYNAVCVRHGTYMYVVIFGE